MNYIAIPNILLEALTFLGRKASGNTWSKIDEKIQKRNLPENINFTETFNKLKAFTNYLDDNISIDNDILKKYFSNCEGFPFNTIGSNSIAFLIFYGVLQDFKGNFKELLAEMKTFSQEHIAYNIATALDISDSCKKQYSMTAREFMDAVLSLAIPAESKVYILDIYRNYFDYLNDISKCLEPVINILKEEEKTLLNITNNFNKEISQIGCNNFFKQVSQLTISKDVKYNLQPFIFGMDTNLTSNCSNNYVNIYCGILRKELLEMLSTQVSYIDDIYEAYHILGDRTRFDIICYLKKQNAYGQELSKHLNLSRNTIHHHMNKLINNGFVTCTTDGNRVYYSLNRATFEAIIEKQRELFCSDK